jgi:hypothetical protein
MQDASALSPAVRHCLFFSLLFRAVRICAKVFSSEKLDGAPRFLVLLHAAPALTNLVIRRPATHADIRHSQVSLQSVPRKNTISGEDFLSRCSLPDRSRLLEHVSVPPASLLGAGRRGRQKQVSVSIRIKLSSSDSRPLRAPRRAGRVQFASTSPPCLAQDGPMPARTS